MAKIHVRGAAERRFPADQMEITVSVRASSVSSGEATRQGRAKTEQLLTLLQDRFGIPPEEAIPAATLRPAQRRFFAFGRRIFIYAECEYKTTMDFSVTLHKILRVKTV